jgi:hypothetical protein
MTLSSCLDCPISKLDHDLLWNIFTINVIDGGDFFYPLDETEYSPLTTTRRCSQVCIFWREIILDSPTLWGECIDLDTLVEGRNEWHDEVLRRTGKALLSVRARSENSISSGTALHCFLINLIHEHWARIQLFDVVVESDQTLDDPRVWTAFSRPARYLREFSILSVDYISDTQDTIDHPRTFRLFSDDAPLLTHFSLHNYRIILPFSSRPFSPVFRTTQLQTLSLHQPTELAASDLLIACEQMPHLEVLAVTIGRLIPDNQHDTLSSSHRHVALPKLRTIDLSGPNLGIYSGFLGRISTHSGCTLAIETTLSWTEARPIQEVTPSVREMQRVFSQFANAFFDHHRDGILPVVDLTVTLMPGYLEFTTYHHRFSFRLLSGQGDSIPDIILDSMLAAISSLRLPSTISQLNLFIPSQHPRFAGILLQIFLVLTSVQTVVTAPTSLLCLANLTQSPTIVFPILKTIFIRGSISFVDEAAHIKHFLAGRQHTAPVEALDFTMSRWPLGDLRFLDEITGLKVVWVRDRVTSEYVCGSGSPEKLLLGGDTVDEQTPSNYL